MNSDPLPFVAACVGGFCVWPRGAAGLRAYSEYDFFDAFTISPHGLMTGAARFGRATFLTMTEVLHARQSARRTRGIRYIEDCRVPRIALHRDLNERRWTPPGLSRI